MLPVATPQPTQEPVYLSGARPPLPLVKLSKGDQGEAVWWLQKKLTEMGYFTGKCSGSYLDGTVKAVAAFQSDHALSASGTADVQTLQLLYEKELATIAPAPTPNATEEIMEHASATDLQVV